MVSVITEYTEHPIQEENINLRFAWKIQGTYAIPAKIILAFLAMEMLNM